MDTKELEAVLKKAFKVDHLEIVDDSASHRGHAGNQSGGSHFSVLLVSDDFKNKSLVDRHRDVNESLAEIFKSGDIHALSLKTLTPEEWRTVTAPLKPY